MPFRSIFVGHRMAFLNFASHGKKSNPSSFAVLCVRYLVIIQCVYPKSILCNIPSKHTVQRPNDCLSNRQLAAMFIRMTIIVYTSVLCIVS